MRNRMVRTGKGMLCFMAVMLAFWLNAGSAQAGNSFATATPVGLDQRVVSNFIDSEDSQFYSFTTDGARAYYSVNFGRNASTTKWIEIYEGPDASYSKVLAETFYDNGNRNYAVTFLPGKTYYIRCGSRDNGGESNFTISRILDDYANILSQGTPITIGKTVTGRIEVDDRGEVDTFTFKTSKNNSFYEVDLANTGNNGVYARIYQGPDESYNYEEIYAGSGDTNYHITRLDKNKTYYIWVKGRWDEATNYKVTVKEIRDDASDDFKGATVLKNNKMKTGRLQIAKDVDFYRFKTGKSQGAYQFYFKNKSSQSMKITIYGNNDIASAISTVKDYYVYEATTKKFFLSLKKNKTYYVKVTGGDGASYNLQFADMKKLFKTTYPTGFKAKGYSGWYSRYTSMQWNNVINNATYEIYRSTSRNSGYKRIKRLKNTAYYTDNTVKRKRTYYYKIRYTIKDNGKEIYSKFSPVKKVRIK